VSEVGVVVVVVGEFWGERMCRFGVVVVVMDDERDVEGVLGFAVIKAVLVAVDDGLRPFLSLLR